jgi:hypothetical protein
MLIYDREYVSDFVRNIKDRSSEQMQPKGAITWEYMAVHRRQYMSRTK